ncbi:hypothetical protein, partial [uncultured Holdemania sp.]|uniref:hypothetical protein n=1 Tax=uncultured Holdemania sp. TaxID=527664 RepID=UPI002804D0C5
VICGDFIVTEILTYVSFFMLKKKRRWFPPTPKFIEPILKASADGSALIGDHHEGTETRTGCFLPELKSEEDR